MQTLTKFLFGPTYLLTSELEEYVGLAWGVGSGARLTIDNLTVCEFSFRRVPAGGVSKVRDRDHDWDESNNLTYKLFLG
jgi:hypothetical protein